MAQLARLVLRRPAWWRPPTAAAWDAPASVLLLGQGDVGKVYLVRLCSSRDIFAMKVLSKAEMIKRNKVGLLLNK